MIKHGAKMGVLMLMLTACSATITPAGKPSPSPSSSTPASSPTPSPTPTPAAPSAPPSATPIPDTGPDMTPDMTCDRNAGETVHGRIVDAAGKPVADAEITLKVTETGFLSRCPASSLLSARSASDGNYSFAGGVIGAVRTELTVARAGYASQTIVIVPILSRAGDSINRFDFTLVAAK